MRLTEARLEKITKFLHEQVPSAQAALEQRRDRYRHYVRRYEAQSIEKNWPWPGASSVHAPMVAITMDAIKARILNALFAQDRIIHVEPIVDLEIPGMMDPETGEQLTWRHIAQLLEVYLNFEVSPAGEVNYREFVEELVDEVLLLGTSFPRCYWKRTVDYQTGEDGEISERVGYDNVMMDIVPTEQIIVPRGYKDLERIPWISYTYPMRPSEILSRVQTDGWQAKTVKRFLENADPAPISELVQEFEEKAVGLVEDTYLTGEVQVAQTWARVPWDEQGREASLLIDHSVSEPIHIFNIRPWPNENGKMDFVGVARYIRRRHYMFGMGIPERLSTLDEAYSSILNQAIDNGTIANTRIWSINEHAVGPREFDVLYPNMKIPRGDDPNDIQPLQLGEVYPSLYENLNIVNMLIEKTAMLNEYQLGREASALNGQATATATLALIQEGGQYHESTSRDIRNVLNEANQQWVDLLAQHKPMDRVSAVLGRQAVPLLAALSLSQSDLRKRLAIRVSFSSTAATRELARQEEMAKFEVMRNYYSGLVELAGTRMQAPQIAPLIDMIAKDGTYRIRRLLETFGESLVNSTLPDWDKAMGSADAAIQQQPPQAPPGAEGSQPVGAGPVPPGTPPGGAPAGPPAGGQLGFPGEEPPV